jgi:GxxExxY protein
MPLIEADPYSRRVIGCAIEVHCTPGPGLLESVYESCSCNELGGVGIAFVRQQLPVVYIGRLQGLHAQLRPEDGCCGQFQ